MALQVSDTQTEPAAGSKSGSNLERVLAGGHFAVTGELGPPKGPDLEIVRKKVRQLKGFVDAANITDNQTAIVRLSSVAAGIASVQEGLEPVIQMTCRDRNRLAVQSDLLGAAAHGIRGEAGDVEDQHRLPRPVLRVEIGREQLAALEC